MPSLSLTSSVCPKLSCCFLSLMIVSPEQRCLQGRNLVSLSDPFLRWSSTGGGVPGTTKWITCICQEKWWCISHYQQQYLPHPIFTKGSFFEAPCSSKSTYWKDELVSNNVWFRHYFWGSRTLFYTIIGSFVWIFLSEISETLFSQLL